MRVIISYWVMHSLIHMMLCPCERLHNYPSDNWLMVITLLL